MIVNNLDVEPYTTEHSKGILSLRLTSSHWCSNVENTPAFRNMFKHLTVHYHPRSLALLASIASHPTLSRAVEKLSVSTQCFTGHELNSQEWIELPKVLKNYVVEQPAFENNEVSIRKLGNAI
ncbi:hypothetical protein EJ08DRAFT_653508 [Tothia fuscella]|uniref:Uncharacterized protein n=1 Tax=Tothia fuscella TaxID=1048955 RepID=A0A9P4NHB8_9PEZI|nr:hypothetical protein EJ08DRAFT_653508 [Tothia fuscella]